MLLGPAIFSALNCYLNGQKMVSRSLFVAMRFTGHALDTAEDLLLTLEKACSV